MAKIYTVEGNIGSGKSTLVKILKKLLPQRISATKFIFLQEPVDIWNIDKKNIDNVSIKKKEKKDSSLNSIYEMQTPKKDELKTIDLPYGFKLNAFGKIPDNYVVKSMNSWGDEGNPKKILGINKDLTEGNFFNFVKSYMDEGATILGGCCEIRPSHIKEISRLKISNTLNS